MGESAGLAVLTLGIVGSGNTASQAWIPGMPRGYFHDSAAVLVRDGQVVVAIEEERLNRIKHTNAFPLLAIERCLQVAGVTLDQVDAIAFPFEEAFCDQELQVLSLRHPALPLDGMRSRIIELLGPGDGVPPIHFVSHHVAHATGAATQSGYDDGTVLVIDGTGERDAVTAFVLRNGVVGPAVFTMANASSFGQLYFHGTRFLGFGVFDQYKVMGLAPYGDGRRYRDLFQGLYRFGPDGHIDFAFGEVDDRLLRAGVVPRRRGSPIEPAHVDLAAALQDTLEDMIGHVLDHLAPDGDPADLCLTGGVAMNCAMSGGVARRGRFRRVFVDFAPHDAGTAAGAALAVGAQLEGATAARRPSPHRSVFLGTDIGDAAMLEELARAWGEALVVTKVDDVVAATAEALADGAVVGWVHGRAEFGPRALGHRSILADPRPRENRDRVNRRVKGRESFRPFAPSVTVEDADTYFDIASSTDAPGYMSMTCSVRPEWRAALGAVTHVDGSARVQVVTAGFDRRFWELLTEFGRHTGVPVLLNTSFNNAHEPIVESATDVLRAFLTMDLDLLVLGDLHIRRGRPLVPQDLVVRVAGSAVLGRDVDACWIDEIGATDRSRRTPVDAGIHELLGTGRWVEVPEDRAADLVRLWGLRLVDVRPR